MKGALTDVAGIAVGHDTDLAAGTGCTVILCPDGAVAGVDIRGSAPATRETALLGPTCLVEHVHAILLAGGSAFGLDAAAGVMRFLEERGQGFPTRVGPVPIVPAAALFDLAIGRSDVRPDAAAGYRACLAARDRAVAEGNAGAGTGATVGKVLGPTQSTKGGLGTCSRILRNGTVVAGLAAVNSFGAVVDPGTNAVLAGPRRPDGGGIADTIAELERGASQIAGLTNTTLAVVATDAPLTKAQATKVAQMAQDGVALAIRPSHAMSDGDVVFALATGRGQTTDVTLLGALAAEVLAQAILRAVQLATGLHGVPAAGEL